MTKSKKEIFKKIKTGIKIAVCTTLVLATAAVATGCSYKRLDGEKAGVELAVIAAKQKMPDIHVSKPSEEQVLKNIEQFSKDGIDISYVSALHAYSSAQDVDSIYFTHNYGPIKLILPDDIDQEIYDDLVKMAEYENNFMSQINPSEKLYVCKYNNHRKIKAYPIPVLVSSAMSANEEGVACTTGNLMKRLMRDYFIAQDEVIYNTKALGIYLNQSFLESDSVPHRYIAHSIMHEYMHCRGFADLYIQKELDLFTSDHRMIKKNEDLETRSIMDYVYLNHYGLYSKNDLMLKAAMSYSPEKGLLTEDNSLHDYVINYPSYKTLAETSKNGNNLLLNLEETELEVYNSEGELLLSESADSMEHWDNWFSIQHGDVRDYYNLNSLKLEFTDRLVVSGAPTTETFPPSIVLREGVIYCFGEENVSSYRVIDKSGNIYICESTDDATNNKKHVFNASENLDATYDVFKTLSSPGSCRTFLAIKDNSVLSDGTSPTPGVVNEKLEQVVPENQFAKILWASYEYVCAKETDTGDYNIYDTKTLELVKGNCTELVREIIGEKYLFLLDEETNKYYWFNLATQTPEPVLGCTEPMLFGIETSKNGVTEIKAYYLSKLDENKYIIINSALDVIDQKIFVSEQEAYDYIINKDSQKDNGAELQ